MNNPTIIYYETSALDGSNVNEVFASVAQNHLRIQGELKTENKDVPQAEGEPKKKKFDLED